MTSTPPDLGSTAAPRRRRLRAVFAADVANFGGLVSVDETRTLDGLTVMRRIAKENLANYGGWLFGLPGDGIFALFESAVDAVRCALDIQVRLASQPQFEEIRLRIGIHLGEVVFENELPFGEALVIAARLESLAEPGSILVSAAVREAVALRINAHFIDLGVRQLKHSPRLVSTFKVSPVTPLGAARKASEAPIGEAETVLLDATPAPAPATPAPAPPAPAPVTPAPVTAAAPHPAVPPPSTAGSAAAEQRPAPVPEPPAPSVSPPAPVSGATAAAPPAAEPPSPAVAAPPTPPAAAAPPPAVVEPSAPPVAQPAAPAAPPAARVTESVAEAPAAPPATPAIISAPVEVLAPTAREQIPEAPGPSRPAAPPPAPTVAAAPPPGPPVAVPPSEPKTIVLLSPRPVPPPLNPAPAPKPPDSVARGAPPAPPIAAGPAAAGSAPASGRATAQPSPPVVPAPVQPPLVAPTVFIPRAPEVPRPAPAPFAPPSPPPPPVSRPPVAPGGPASSAAAPVDQESTTRLPRTEQFVLSAASTLDETMGRGGPSRTAGPPARLDRSQGKLDRSQAKLNSTQGRLARTRGTTRIPADVAACQAEFAKALTTHLGPIARVLVKRHAASAESARDLADRLAAEVSVERERREFQEIAKRIIDRMIS